MKKIYVLISKWDDGTEHVLYAIKSERKAKIHLNQIEATKEYKEIEYYLREIDLITL